MIVLNSAESIYLGKLLILILEENLFRKMFFQASKKRLNSTPAVCSQEKVAIFSEKWIRDFENMRQNQTSKFCVQPITLDIL